MRHFIQHLLTFISILIAINIALSKLLNCEPFYGNNEFVMKLDSANSKFHNYYFFGSSRIATGLDPIVFDSIMHLHNEPSQSFNLATHGTFFCENEYLLDHFEQLASVKNSTVFVEFNNVMSVDRKRLDTDKNLYYQNLSNLRFILEFAGSDAFRSPKELLVSSHYILSYSLSGFLAVLNLGKSDCLVAGERHENKKWIKGFEGLHAVYKGKFKPLTYLSSTKEAFESNQSVNEALKQKFLDRIDKGKKLGIHYYFILTPKNYTADMASIFKCLPKENRMDLNEFQGAESLYDPSLWADFAHLNYKGASQYSDLVAREYLLNNRSTTNRLSN
jgi:hypothetical protein